MVDHANLGPIAEKDATVSGVRSRAKENSFEDQLAQSEFEASLDAALRLVSEQSVVMTGASGSAIALKQGELMVCRARAGTTAPELGAQFDGTSGLSGECVRTGRLLICHDTESDPRVDLSVCRLLGIRSMVVMPLYLGVELIGVFEVFSSTPSGFGRHEISVLESMGELIVSVVEPAPDVPSRPNSEPTGGSVLAKIARNGSGTSEAPDGKPLPSSVPTQYAKPDVGDDLICEIESGNGNRQAGTPDRLATLSKPLPPSEAVGRKRAHKPILAGIVLLAGLLGFGWWIRSVRDAKTEAVEAQTETPANSSSQAVPDSQAIPSPVGEQSSQTRSEDNQAAPTPSKPQDGQTSPTNDPTSELAAKEAKSDSPMGELSGDAGRKADASDPTNQSPSGVKVSVAQSIKRLRSSAESGNPDAQLALAVRYADGDGLKQSYADALKWFARAEAQGLFPTEPKALDAEQRAQAWAANK